MKNQSRLALVEQKECSRVIAVTETAKTFEHICGPGCFKAQRTERPRSLSRIGLGYAYLSQSGMVYIKLGEDWMEVSGMTFYLTNDGRLVKVFKPVGDMLIHSAAGKTISKVRTAKTVKAGESLLAQEATKKLKGKGYNLKAAQNYLRIQAATIIPHAPRHKRTIRGIGRGAPGVPRSALGFKIVELMRA